MKTSIASNPFTIQHLGSGNSYALNSRDFSAGTKRTLVAQQVPSGTSIVITFQAAKFTPGLDNVSIAIRELDSSAPAVTPPAQSGPPVTVACYYFGNYHVGDHRNEKNTGQGWSEWELVNHQATPPVPPWRPAHLEHQLLERMDRRQLPRTGPGPWDEVSRGGARRLPSRKKMK